MWKVLRILTQGPVTIKMEDGSEILVGVMAARTDMESDECGKPGEYDLGTSIFAHRGWILENFSME